MQTTGSFVYGYHHDNRHYAGLQSAERYAVVPGGLGVLNPVQDPARISFRPPAPALPVESASIRYPSAHLSPSVIEETSAAEQQDQHNYDDDNGGRIHGIPPSGNFFHLI